MCMSDESSPVSGVNELRALLFAWINTETWQMSQEFFTTHSEQLLSEEAFHELEDMLAEAAEGDEKDEREGRMLRRHRRLLETVRASTLDDAYTPLLHPSPPILELSEYSAEMVLLSRRCSVARNYPISLSSSFSIPFCSKWRRKLRW